ncbi:hypothetical protein BDY19DRAFT_16672 [Irpex rosettiformis]|uniref:Uncharacterized protein n=1 Tax=Irpex rosettiformis TaxID=378272 RepID=A0ACB8UJ30_9APHY|nr:hypothetical protein BDY19DRAFT_16672 [Irpex rosettiformis]
MAQWQAYQANAAKNSPTLMPGQTIAVNKYTVQVERYLSQGGFAHVYLVRTAQPVYNTTHHVLKRIAVPDEAMLTEVKKEVDIMRILKGHPNIVHLIDAASHRMANGAYEVFILMEYCPGGGIIDMMNRRLRERLTEAEILTIFVDVCEGLAAMHALKPPLLHRDLKVENILQSSATSYKLCDFGSATSVHKVPSTGEELRALQADLDRHTTMQYRAPEMVNLMQRRPIDEKSDVWALGVLLYKLCYYTTPFEERGPLAIQNVNYTIPPYPVYSQNMITLIGSMLREYGTQRPTIFELLNHVHALRGTTSRFTYNIPHRQHHGSARPPVGSPLQTLSPNIIGPGVTSPANPLDDLVVFKSRSGQPSASPSKNAGVQARDKVLEAIAPMRRGRPPPQGVPSPSASPSKDHAKLSAEMKLPPVDDRAWGGVRGHKSGMASIGDGKPIDPNAGGDPWGIDSKATSRSGDTKQKAPEKNMFESDFSASPALGFGDSFEPPRRSAQTASPRNQPILLSRPLPSPAPSGSVSANRAPPRDAFEGLGLTTLPAPQTLGDARKARTGLAASNFPAGLSQPPSGLTPSGLGLGSSTTTYRPPSTHAPSPAPIPQARVSPRPQSPAFQSSSWQNLSNTPRRPVELSAEERFPSLEDLDRTFSPPSQSRNEPAIPTSTKPSSLERLAEKPSISHPRPPLTAPSGAPGLSRTGNPIGTMAHGLGEPKLARHASLSAGRYDGTRSQQVTGTAMRESRLAQARQGGSSALQPPAQKPIEVKPTPLVSRHSRPVQPRRHRSSLAMRTTSPIGEAPTRLEVPLSHSPAPPALPLRPSPQPEQRDWLTGVSDDEAAAPVSQPVLRDSPSKRASFIERSPIQLEKGLEAVSGGIFSQESSAVPLDVKHDEPGERLPKERPPPSRSASIQRRISVRRTQSPEKQKTGSREVVRGGRSKSRERREGRRSPTKSKTYMARTGTGNVASAGAPGGLKFPGMETKPKPLQVTMATSGLTDNWSPVTSPTRDVSREGSSSSDEEPEDIGGYKPSGGSDGSTGQNGSSRDMDATSDSKLPHHGRSGGKGRQSSVHDLVDLWGGAQPPKSPSKIADKRRSAIVTSSSMKQPLPGLTGVRLSSPERVSNTPQPAGPRPSTPSRINRPPSRQRKSTLSNSDSSSRAVPTSSSAAVTSPPLSSTPSSRARPQSMFLNPVAKTAPLEASLSSSTSIVKQPAQPSEEKPRRTGRRTSISDMVHRYESINGAPPTKPSSKPPPPIATKPTVVSKAMSEASSAGLPSPSSAATRFPRLSPESSPVQTKSQLAVPSTLENGKEESLQRRRSPSPAISGLPPRSYASPVKPITNTTGAGSNISSKVLSEIKQQAQSLSSRTQESIVPVQPQARRDTLSPPSTTDLRSPSPEKPYQGVSKLIDRWQRVVDQSDSVDKRAPSSSLRGR